jgi:hypothetical protein
MSTTDIEGLSVRTDWITPEQERALLERIDASEWRADILRRVQHYGWRYDYKARSGARGDQRQARAGDRQRVRSGAGNLQAC